MQLCLNRIDTLLGTPLLAFKMGRLAGKKSFIHDNVTTWLLMS